MIRNKSLHQVDSPFLIGSLKQEDEIKEAKQETYIDGQLSLFDDLHLPVSQK